jgi:hypothetical protein
VAVGAIGMSTAVLGVTGTASAAPLSPISFTATDSPLKIAVGYCSIDWTITGAQGGANSNGDAGAFGGRLAVTTLVATDDEFDFFTGGVGADGQSAAVGAAGGLSGNVAYYDGQPGGLDAGGGGAATVVRRNGQVVLSAFGGHGADAAPGTGGVGGDATHQNVWSEGTLTSAQNSAVSTDPGPGAVTGVIQPCAPVSSPTGSNTTAVAPGAPQLDDYVAAGDGTAKFWFAPGSNALDQYGTYVPSTYEYQLDGGTWTAFTTGPTGDDAVQNGTITGLTNMKKYSLALRATGASGNSPASAPVTFTPFRSTAAPASVSASVGVSSVRISWTPPADAADVVDYLAFVVPDGAQSSQDLVTCTSTGTSCAMAVTAGLAYSYGVTSRDALGNEGDRIFGENPTAAVPASAISATLPTSNGALTSSDADGKVVAGTPVTISGTGFLPGSTVELIVYSTPVKLGQAVVLADGSFSATVTLPKSLTDGVHNLVATGVDADGNVRNLVVEVTVSGGTAVLADTGFSAAPVLGAGALALLAGGGLLVAARRRQAT